MITKYVCNADECPNKGIIYNMEDVTGPIMCGGCFETIHPMP